MKDKLNGLEKEKDQLKQQNHYFKESRSRLRLLNAKTTVALEDKLKAVTKQLKMQREQNSASQTVDIFVEDKMLNVSNLHQKLMSEIQEAGKSTDRLLKDQEDDLLRMFNAKLNQANSKIIEQFKKKDEEIQNLKEERGWNDFQKLQRNYLKMEDFNSKLQNQNVEMKNRIKDLESRLSLSETQNETLIRKVFKLKNMQNTDLTPVTYEDSPTKISKSSCHKTSRDTLRNSFIHDTVISSLQQELQSAQDKIKLLNHNLKSQQQKRHSYYDLIEVCLADLKRDAISYNPMSGKILNLTISERNQFINLLAAKSQILEHVKKELKQKSLPYLSDKKRAQSVASLVNDR